MRDCLHVIGGLGTFVVPTRLRINMGITLIITHVRCHYRQVLWVSLYSTLSDC